MTELRYVGTSPWGRVLLKENGTFDRQDQVMPGDTITLDNDHAAKVLGRPRNSRDLVEVNGPEDTYGERYSVGRFGVQGNASAYPELDFGSTVQPGRAIFVTNEDNPEGFNVADPYVGPASDNSDLILRNEAREVGAKAEADARDKRAAASKPQGKTTQQTRPSNAEGSQKPNGE